MQIATPGTMVDRLYRDWRRDVANLNRQAAEYAEAEGILVLSPMWLDVIRDDVAFASGREQGSRWAFATVLHALNSGGVAVVPNWTYGAGLALAYHWQVQRARLTSAPVDPSLTITSAGTISNGRLSLVVDQGHLQLVPN